MRKLLTRQDFHIFQDGMLDRFLNPVADDTASACGWAGMGTGKTAVGLTLVRELEKAKELTERTLVVSTKKAAVETWQHEHKHWEQLQYQADRTTLLSGTPEERIAKLQSPGIHIINQENLRWLVQGFGVKDWPYKLVIVDDCKGLKMPRSVTYSMLRAIRPVTDRIINLTGTPMPRGYEQLWPQIALIDGGKRLYKSKRDYINRFFEPNENGFGYSLRDPEYADEIARRVSDIAFSVDPKDYLDVPEVHDRVIGFDLPESVRDQYEELEQEFFLLLESVNDGDIEIEAPNVGVVKNKLRQICNGAMYYEDGKKFQVIHDAKLDLLEQIVEESNGENLIVAYNYTSDWERIKQRFPQAVHINSHESNVRRWNDGDISMLCCHPGSAGHGLNLQYGGRTIVWFGAEWGLELNQQMDERIGAVRQAQSGLNNTPVYLRLAARNSVEQDVATALSRKAREQNDLTHAVKLGMAERKVDPLFAGW